MMMSNKTDTKFVDRRVVRHPINSKSRLSHGDAHTRPHSQMAFEDKRLRNRLSLQDMSKLILSPEPVPLDPDIASGAILQAAQRSSRTHSVISGEHSETSSLHSERISLNPRDESRREKIVHGRVKPRRPGFSLRSLLCCLSNKSPDHRQAKAARPRRPRKERAQRTGELASVHDGVKSVNGVSEPVVADGRPGDVTDAAAPVELTYSTKLSPSYPPRRIPPGSAYSSSSRPASCPNTDMFSCSTNHVVSRSPPAGINHQLPIITTKQVSDYDAVAEQTPPRSSALADQSDIPDVDENGSDDTSSENILMDSPGINLLGDPTPEYVEKKCLVLDLDETLVHSWFKSPESSDLIVSVDIDSIIHQIFVCKRPYLDEFMEIIGPLFECVMFTASLRKYADPVCDFIDKKEHLRHRLFREHCVAHQSNLIKDLSRLGRDVDQICIIDNSPVSFLFQPSNALHIVSWLDDPMDSALRDLIPYLVALSRSPDTAVQFLRDNRPPATTAYYPPQMPNWLYVNFNNHQQQVRYNEDYSDIDDEDAAYFDDDDDDIQINTGTALVPATPIKRSLPSNNNTVNPVQIATPRGDNSLSSIVHQASR